MAEQPRITRRGLAALAAAAAGLPRRSAAEQAPPTGAEPAATPAVRLQRAAGRVARCEVPRETQPAVHFAP